MALGLTLGIIIAVSGGNTTKIDQSALGASASPSGSASASALASAPPSASPGSSTPATTTAANVNCDIIVPADPLSAQGLATPYQLTGTDGQSPALSGCEMSNAANLGAFVQATILDPRTGALSVYDPLVITQGTTAAIAPAVLAIGLYYYWESRAAGSKFYWRYDLDGYYDDLGRAFAGGSREA